MEEPFREICEEQPNINNLSFDIRLIRISLRYIIRFFGIQRSINLFEILYKLFSKFILGKKTFYFYYLIRINHFRLSFLNELSNDNFEKAIEIKTDWANYVCKESFNKLQRYNARAYLRLISGKKISQNKEVNSNQSTISDKPYKKKIYIYGPNALEPPNKKYKDFSLIVTRPYDGNIEDFKESFLFINSFYYHNVVIKESLETDLLNNYDKCYVSCRNAILPKEFNRSKFPTQGYFGSSMALGRILYTFAMEYGSFECVIEGFDLYLASNPYRNKKYHKLSRQTDGSIEEIDFIMSLAEHDYIYNFLFLQDLMERFTLTDSPKFREIMDMSWKDYAKRLHESRNFKAIRNI